MRHFLILILGVFFCSTSVILMRLSELPPAQLSAYRLLFATVILLPLFLKDWRAHSGKFKASMLKRCLLPAALLSIHLVSWTQGSRMTYIANASLIINLTPALMPFLAHFLIKERVKGREIAGTLVALSGVCLLSVNAFSIDAQYLWGNLICFASMCSFALYLAFARLNKDFPTIWLYMVPLYAIAGAMTLGYAAVSLPTILLPSWEEAGWMLCMALFPTILGHVTLNRSLRYIPAQSFSVVNLHQFVFAGIMGWLIFADLPPLAFYPSAALCIAGAALVIQESVRSQRGSA